MKKFYVYLFGFALVFSACKKEIPPVVNPPLSVVPQVYFIDVQPDDIKEFDDVVFTIGFRDGDGNIGSEDADIKDLFVTDDRFPLTEAYHIPPVAPPGEIKVQGEFVVTLKNVILKDQNNTSENVVFSIYLKDRDGNLSNTIDTESMVITK